MKKLLMIGLVFISSLTFADSGSLNLNLGDGHRGGADIGIAVSVNEGDTHRYHQTGYVEKEVHIYEEPRYIEKEVHVYHQPRYVEKEVHRYKHHKHKQGHKKPQKVIVVHKH
ncbi:hypothetical protein [uncultured Ilyobacter sp.]|uniref:hypothetical protein n=1 Tax=uncultured Ilyobacter sp. TaxID=544433 RepID=UPI0029C8D40C|nr:hypothetical protein [uncultured Ilyobacter sp.]